MKILGVIPARGGSKGIIKKNIKALNGKPLLNYTIEAALPSFLTKLVVSSEDEAILKMATELGLETPFIRPDELATDEAKSIDVAKHALTTMEKIDSCIYDALMLLQPTTPFRSTDDINEAIQILQQEPSSDSVISVVDVKGHHPARMKYMEHGKLIDPPFCEAYENQNRQELRPMYIRNGAIYLTRRDVLFNDSYKGNVCSALIMPEERSVNIDTPSDFEYAEWLGKGKMP